MRSTETCRSQYYVLDLVYQGLFEKCICIYCVRIFTYPYSFCVSAAIKPFLFIWRFRFLLHGKQITIQNDNCSTSRRIEHEVRKMGSQKPPLFCVRWYKLHSSSISWHNDNDHLPFLSHSLPSLCGAMTEMGERVLRQFLDTKKNGSSVQKPNSCTYNFVEVGLNLEGSQTWGFYICTMFTLQTSFNPILPKGGGG